MTIFQVNRYIHGKNIGITYDVMPYDAWGTFMGFGYSIKSFYKFLCYGERKSFLSEKRAIKYAEKMNKKREESIDKLYNFVKSLPNQRLGLSYLLLKYYDRDIVVIEFKKNRYGEEFLVFYTDDGEYETIQHLESRELFLLVKNITK